VPKMYKILCGMLVIPIILRSVGMCLLFQKHCSRLVHIMLGCSFKGSKVFSTSKSEVTSTQMANLKLLREWWLQKQISYSHVDNVIYYYCVTKIWAEILLDFICPSKSWVTGVSFLSGLPP